MEISFKHQNINERFPLFTWSSFDFFLIMRVLCRGFILLFYVVFFARNIKRFMARLCPGGKMSCVGKYPRNVLNFTTSVKLALAWGFFPIFRQFVLLAYAHLGEQVSSEYIFYIDTLLWALCSDVFYTYLHLKLRRRGIPSITENSRTANFSALSASQKAFEARSAIVSSDDKRTFSCPKQNHLGELIDNGNDQKSFNEVPSTSHFYEKAPFELLPNQVEERTSEICERSSETRFSYFSKVCRDKATPTLERRAKSNSLEMWRHETLNSSDSKRKILFYSRHISVTE